MFITKSDYCTYWRCPKLFWLEKNCPDIKNEDPKKKSKLEEGKEIGCLARGYFGDYIDVTTLTEEGYLDLATMIQKTKECINDGVENICEAGFCHGDLYCAVDILHKEGAGYAIYEVKGGTKEEKIHSADIAFQKYVLEKCGICVTGTYLLCLDSDYIRGKDLDISRLFKIINVANGVELELARVEENVKNARDVLVSAIEPNCDLCMSCHKPYDCEYWSYCTNHLPHPSVFELYNMQFSKKLEYYYKGFVRFEDLQSLPKLTPMRAMQIRHELTSCGDQIDSRGIGEFLDTLSYPLYFLDFESMQPAIPLYEGTWAYQQIPFQYSLHYIETPEGEILHKEFLGISGENPLRPIAESICKDIPKEACVVVFNQNFECTRLKELAAMFPDLSEHLLVIRDNIKDLLEPFRKGYYYNRAMEGSFSIKKVLPALFPNDPELDYHSLEGVHHGGEAMELFPKIKDMPQEEQEKARRNLLEYCKLDTWATVKIWQKLNENRATVI